MVNLNIIFITQEDPFYLPIFFGEFFKDFQIDEVSIKNIVILKHGLSI